MSDNDFDSFRNSRGESPDGEEDGPLSSQPINDNVVDRQNLLDPAPEDANDAIPGEQGQGGMFTQAQVNIAIKRAVDPLIYEVKRCRVQIEVNDKKVTNLLHQGESTQKQLKEMKSLMMKGCEDVTQLLTGEGVLKLKKTCLRNLDMKAKEEQEKDLFDQFIERAKEEGWLLKTSAKALKDILTAYREKRNYLKAQIRLRIHEDVINKTPTQAAKLTKTTKFLREHLGVAELGNDLLQVVYHYTYVLIKYLNQNVEPASLSENEKKIQKKAQKSVWVYVMQRVDADKRAKRDYTVTKDKIFQMLEGGAIFVPC